MLKNLMEDKQLDLNRPILSVRRVPPATIPVAENKGKIPNSLPSVPLLPSYRSDLNSGPIRDAGVVPFVWEQTPGRPKDETTPQRTWTPQRPPVAPKLPPGRIMNPTEDKDVSSLDKEEMKETSNSGSEDGDEAFVDARDTLSRSESIFLNCSVSGLSGLDGPDVEPSGTFSTDPQTRDFMMGRFLPAAKAMASEAPQHVSRRQPLVPRKQPREFKVVDKPSVYQYRPSILSQYGQHRVGEESEDEDDDYDKPENSNYAVCGMFPRLKNSLCLLNPVPGMRPRPRLPKSSVKARRPKPSYAGSSSRTVNELYKDAAYIEKSTGGPQITNVDDSQNHESSLYKRLQGGRISPYRNEQPSSLFHDEEGFLGFPNNPKNFNVNDFVSNQKISHKFRGTSSNHGTKWDPGSHSPAVEKTLYIDSIHTVKPRGSNSSLSPKEHDFEFRPPSVDSSSLPDIKHMNISSEKGTTRPNIFEFDSKVTSSEKGPLTLGSMIVADDENRDFEIEEVSREYNGGHLQFVLAPPLPKSPSDSWLWRTLPSIPSRNPSSQNHHWNQASNKASAGDPKWETIVKTSKFHHGHLRFSEELLKPVSET